MKIALLDLNHMTSGVHTNTVPLGMGLIAEFLKKFIDSNQNIKIFRKAERALNDLKDWDPDVLGISQYCWNSELNLFVAEKIKKMHPKCLLVAGGPNLELSSEGKKIFLKRNEFVDIGVAYDGEIPFAEIIKRLNNGDSIRNIKSSPSAGTYSFNHEDGKLNESQENPPRLDSLNYFGPIYADGIFDQFLEEGFHPFVQTHRGCPFTCAFCHTSSQYYSRMLFLSPEIFRKDMEYLGKMFTGRHDITLYMANTNMSLFKEDFEIGSIIREIQNKYDWPKYINVNSGKDPKKLLDMLSIIEFSPSIALQTLTTNVLKNIRRKNIDFDRYCKFQSDLSRKTDQPSSTELILSLPGETKTSFLETLKQVVNSGVQNIFIYTLMHLKGTPLASKEFSDPYKHVIGYRVVPRQFSLINGHKIFDIEECVIGTKSMPFEHYMELRGICFTIDSIFGSTELIPLKRFLLEYKIDLWKWVINIHAQLSNYPRLNTIYNDFLKETDEELFPSKESLIKFYNKPENYNDLVSGKRGDNLLKKYKFILLSRHYNSLLRLAIFEAKKLAGDKLPDGKAKEIIHDLQKYLCTRNTKKLIAEGNLPPSKCIKIKYNIPHWLKSDEGIPLEAFKGSYLYIVEYPPDSIEKIKKFYEMYRSKDLSLQILYHDGRIRDLWPTWILRN